MIKQNKIKVKTTNKNISFYKKINPSLISGEVVEVDISMLSKGSKQIITVVCDKCEREVDMMYKTYLRILKDDKYFCSDCKYERIKKSNIEKFGVENVFQIEEYYSKTEKWFYRVKETNLQKHNYEFPLQNEEIRKKAHKAIDENREKISLKLKEDIKLKYSMIFLKTANLIHNKKYDYSLTVYTKMTEKVIIICPLHGEFTQRPMDHINLKQGCPICRCSKGELSIKYFLDKNNIKYKQQKSFDDCKYKKLLKFDFYLPEKNICIEYDGEQHYIEIDRWGGESRLKIIKDRDSIKNLYCLENNIKLIRIKYDDNIDEKLKNII